MLRLAVISLAALSFVSVANAQTYNANSDFSSASNPNGVWTYGFTDTLTSSLQIYARSTNTTQFDAWLGDRAGDGNPQIFHNKTNDTLQVSSIIVQPDQLILHPGPNGEYSTLRWTAPEAGEFTVNALFSGQDRTSTDIHIYKNSDSLFSDTISGFGNTKTYTARLTVAVGEIIDLKVGFGGNGFRNDSTGLRYSITAVPSPSALAAFVIGAVPGAAVLLRRRRK